MQTTRIVRDFGEGTMISVPPFLHMHLAKINSSYVIPLHILSGQISRTPLPDPELYLCAFHVFNLLHNIIKASAKHEDAGYLVEGNKLSFQYGGKDYYFNIVMIYKTEYIVEVKL